MARRDRDAHVAVLDVRDAGDVTTSRDGHDARGAGRSAAALQSGESRGGVFTLVTRGRPFDVGVKI